MTKKRITMLADYFYSSSSTEEVPFRLCLDFGMAGDDLSKNDFIKLMTILSNSDDLAKDCQVFLREL